MLKFFKRLLVFCAVILVIYVILLIPRVDSFITERIESLYTTNPNPEYIINTEDMYEENETPPITFVREGNLYVLYKNKAINITRNEINIDDLDYDINSSFTLKKNCRVVSNGKHIIYLLEINGESHLYRLDMEEREVIKIAEKVDSFLITKRGNILYATGYISSNYIYLYKNAESVEIAKDAKAYYMPQHDSMVIRQSDGKILRYIEFDDKVEILDQDTQELYNPYGETHNYINMSNSFAIYYKKASGDFVYTNGEAKQLTKSFNETVPMQIHRTNHEDRYFYYSDKERTLFLWDKGNTYGIMRDVYKIFDYDVENEKFLLATSKAVYIATVGETNRVDTVKMYNLKGIYKRNLSMIRNHLDIVTHDFKTFYSTQISGSSFIFNIFNADSWLNKISVIKYKLYVSVLQGEEFEKIKEVNVPKTYTLTDNLVRYKEDTYIYIPKNRKNQGYSVSFITKDIKTYQNSFDNEPFDSISPLIGLNYIYFVTEVKEGDVKNRLYVYENNTSIMIHKGTFTTHKSLQSIYIVSPEEDLYNISILEGLQISGVASDVIFSN